MPNLFSLNAGGFKILLSIALDHWSYEQCLFVLTDNNPSMRKVAEHVIKEKYIVGPKVEEYADLVDA